MPYTTRTVNLRGDEEQRAWYTANVNPRGKVPALRDPEADLTIFESLLSERRRAPSEAFG